MQMSTPSRAVLKTPGLRMITMTKLMAVAADGTADDDDEVEQSPAIFTSFAVTTTSWLHFVVLLLAKRLQNLLKMAKHLRLRGRTKKKRSFVLCKVKVLAKNHRLHSFFALTGGSFFVFLLFNTWFRMTRVCCATIRHAWDFGREVWRRRRMILTCSRRCISCRRMCRVVVYVRRFATLLAPWLLVPLALSLSLGPGA